MSSDKEYDRAVSDLLEIHFELLALSELTRICGENGGHIDYLMNNEAFIGISAILARISRKARRSYRIVDAARCES